MRVFSEYRHNMQSEAQNFGGVFHREVCSHYCASDLECRCFQEIGETLERWLERWCDCTGENSCRAFHLQLLPECSDPTLVASVG